MSDRDHMHLADSQGIAGGTIPGSGGQAAFSLSFPEPSPVPILMAVPHAGRDYPPRLIGQMRHAGPAVLKLEDRLVDLVAAAVARKTGAALLVAHAPRAMIDLNRAIDEMDWEMLASDGSPGRDGARIGRRARSGLGLVPRRLPGLGEIWSRRLERSELDARIEGVHKPYHEALEASMRKLRDRWGAALLIDVHSMPPLPRRLSGEKAPIFVIGDRFGATCDGTLCAAAFDELSRLRQPAAHNRPYAGGYVLDRHSAPARGLNAIQLEICRASYLDGRLTEPGRELDSVVETIAVLVRRLAGEVAALGRGSQTAQAAE
ncbi:MAG TPA: N-formylglutamate amidohydrolase [Sphingomonadaceae bacterium]|nr:N-formylglutamate amidohydrolase [Sphingomonadaceae bacterium]